MLECQQPSRHKITTRYCCRRSEGLGFLGCYSRLWVRLSRGSFTWCCGAAWLSQEGKPAKNVLFLFLKMLPGLSLPQHSCCIEFILSQLLQLGECLRDAAGASRAVLRREMVEKQPTGRFFCSTHLKKPRCSGVSGGIAPDGGCSLELGWCGGTGKVVKHSPCGVCCSSGDAG